jgi:NAD(P)H-dependent flavin oxidoreductase YrpB (nitropropane dioxygenase family)
VEKEMSMWPDARLTKLFATEHPIVLAPMAGAMDFELAAAVSAAGGLGSLPCAMLTPDTLRDQFAKIRVRTDKPINVNFFCHTPPVSNNVREARWRDARYRSRASGAIEQSDAVRRDVLRSDRRTQAAGRELSFRLA